MTTRPTQKNDADGAIFKQATELVTRETQDARDYIIKKTFGRDGPELTHDKDTSDHPVATRAEIQLKVRTLRDDPDVRMDAESFDHAIQNLTDSHWLTADEIVSYQDMLMREYPAKDIAPYHFSFEAEWSARQPKKT